ncbi:MAG: flagellar export protein FliJ [Kurthia sp.]|nr:flagellar export protein FliJ [Candidatus Kurthia equi]
MSKRYEYRFTPVMVIKEQEKSEAEMAYKQSVSVFEKVATALYDALKKKEDLLEFQQQKMQSGLSIVEMHNYANFLVSMEKKIAELQNKVMQARSKMDWFENKLIEVSLEYKKYEKMKERDFETFLKEEDRLEMIQLDEISQISFYNKEAR